MVKGPCHCRGAFVFCLCVCFYSPRMFGMLTFHSELQRIEFSCDKDHTTHATLTCSLAITFDFFAENYILNTAPSANRGRGMRRKNHTPSRVSCSTPMDCDIVCVCAFQECSRERKQVQNISCRLGFGEWAPHWEFELWRM